MIPFLFDLADNPHPLVRSTSMWVLAKYHKWIMCQVNLEMKTNPYFNRYAMLALGE